MNPRILQYSSFVGVVAGVLMATLPVVIRVQTADAETRTARPADVVMPVSPADAVAQAQHLHQSAREQAQVKRVQEARAAAAAAAAAPAPAALDPSTQALAQVLRDSIQDRTAATAQRVQDLTARYTAEAQVRTETMRADAAEKKLAEITSAAGPVVPPQESPSP